MRVLPLLALLALALCALSSLSSSSSSSSVFVSAAILPDPFTRTVQSWPPGSQRFGDLSAGDDCSAAKGTCVRIGVFRCADPKVAGCRIGGFNEQSEWYVNRIASMGNKINGIPVQFVFANLSATTDNPWNAIKTYFLGAAAGNYSGTATGNMHVNVTYQPFIDFIIMTPGSGWENSMTALEKLNIPAVASNSPLSSLYRCPAPNTGVSLASKSPCNSTGLGYNARRFQYAHSIASSGEQYFSPWVGLMKLKKVSSIGVVYTTVALYPSVVQGIQSAATDLSIQVTKVVKVDTTTLPAGVTALEAEMNQVEAVTQQLMEARPQGLVLVTQNCRLWIQAFRRFDYAPDSLAAISCADDINQLQALGQDLIYVMGSAQWSPDMNGNDYLEDYDAAPWSLFPHQRAGKPINDSSPAQYLHLYRKIMKNPAAEPGYAEAAVLAGLSMLEGAITLTGIPATPELVNEQLKLYYQPSFYGLMSTNRWGINQQKQLVINQRDGDNILRIVSPSSSANMDVIFPMPVFSERVYVLSLMSTPVEYVVIALMVIAMAFTGSLMGYLVLNRHNQVFQAAGLPFYLLMGLGCITAYGSVLTWGVENNQHTCNARIWMWTLGFHMFVDPLLASSWRISRIFSQKLQTVKLTNRTVGLLSLALLTPQIIINIVWATVAPLTATEVNVDILRPAHTSFTTCSSGDKGVILAGATLGYSGLLLLGACYLAYRVRKAYRMFNDAKPIAMSMYIFTVTAAIILVIQIALNNQEVNAQKVLFGLRSVGILVAYTSSISLLYFRRILGQDTGVSKYAGRAGGKAPVDSMSSDSTASGRPATRPSPPHTHMGGATDSTGKIIFNKEGQSGLGGGNNSANPSSHGAGRNVHVHIQPPVINNYSTNGDGTTPTGSPMQRPAGKSLGLGTSPASRGIGAPVAASQLALDNLSRTPSAFAQRTTKPPPLQNQIVQVPPAIPLPSPIELNAMEHSSLVSLVQQFHAQNQVLRSGVRMQNLQTAAAARGEPWTGGMLSQGPSLPGTPDRSPRHGEINSATGTRRPSAMAALNIGTGLSAPSNTLLAESNLHSPSGAFQSTNGGGPGSSLGSPVEMVVIKPYQSSSGGSGGPGAGAGAGSSNDIESAIGGHHDSGSNVTAANIGLDERK